MYVGNQQAMPVQRDTPLSVTLSALMNYKINLIYTHTHILVYIRSEERIYKYILLY